MEYTVETQGMALGVGRRMFVCDAEGSVIVEVFGTDPEDAERRAEAVADALNATVRSESTSRPVRCPDCGHEEHRGKCYGLASDGERCQCYKEPAR